MIPLIGSCAAAKTPEWGIASVTLFTVLLNVVDRVVILFSGTLVQEPLTVVLS
jgi:hypothetical protein